MKHWLTLLFILLGLTAQAQTLDEHHLLLDGSLSNEEVRSKAYVFNDFREAVNNLKDTTTLYVKPWVYWVDNPDVPEVVKGENGREPFGMVIRTKKLSIIGLTDRAEKVVLASQRGQMQGAVGNFTMFDFHVDELQVENLTMGNYCNVDLQYPLNPKLSRKKRSDAITQAHVGYVHGRQLRARNVRFISRLNLNPLNGARESTYDSCHFECTDDALNGNAIYRRCTFFLYGSKPFWSTFGRGAFFADCDFFVKSNNREMHFCKQGGPVTLIDCRYHAPSDSIYLSWTAYPQKWLRCYQQNFTLNGKPYLIGNRQPENTIQLDPKTFSSATVNTINDIPFLNINKHEAKLRAPASLVLKSEAYTQWRVEQGYESFAQISSQVKDEANITLKNETDETVNFCIVAYTEDQREAACLVVLAPTLTEAPAFLKKPEILQQGDSLWLDYALDLQGRRDESVTEWYRDSILVSESHDAPQRSYQLSQADRGHRLTALVMPRHQRSKETTPTSTSFFVKKTPQRLKLSTDFHDFPCRPQPSIVEGCWTVDGHKPADTKDYDWSYDAKKPMWTYGEGFNGAGGKGLLQAQRGARLMYTPLGDSYGDMSLTLQVDPTKTAGQGFGSATGQYMDVCLKFDTHTLTGYGLRIIRTVKHAKAVDFYLIEYRNGTIVPLTEPISATCYRTGCTIRMNYSKGQLTAHVTTQTPRPANSALPHEVSLHALVSNNPFGGIHLQHTGSCGESTTMLHRLEAEWK